MVFRLMLRRAGAGVLTFNRHSVETHRRGKQTETGKGEVTPLNPSHQPYVCWSRLSSCGGNELRAEVSLETRGEQGEED